LIRYGPSRKRLLLRLSGTFSALCLCAGFSVFWATRPCLNWADRRPIGALFLASTAHVSTVNPRGWFNNPGLDVRGSEGASRFRKAILGYADRSIAILKRTGSQGMIVWDLEGEEFPQKTTYIGDPRLLPRLAPEAELVADEFFGKFRKAGLAVGLTIRPQQLTFDAEGHPRQEDVGDYERLLTEKIDYARRRWGATLFYIDSNRGALWPLEVFRLRRIAQQRPQILLIPEHHDFLYSGFSAPYGSMQADDTPTGRGIRRLYPNAFQVLHVAGQKADQAAAAYRGGDILLFDAWFETTNGRLVESLAGHPDRPALPVVDEGR
jgi:hypothetical protein